MATVAVKDVSAATFEDDVITASRERLIVVDFWAPSCGPCRMLSPLLERLAVAAAGAWTLVKVDVDENQSLSGRYGVQGIPAVKAFRDGRVVAEFVGAQPEVSVRRFLDRLLPTPADLAAAEGRRLAEDGDPAGAEAAYREALAADADHAPALLRLGSLLDESGRPDDALETLSAILPRTPQAAEAAPIIARLRLAREAGGAPGLDQARQALARDPRDPAANLALGQALAGRGNYAEALPHLLAVVQRDKAYQNGAARTAMLAIFDALGADDPLTLDYRHKLASALYA